MVNLSKLCSCLICTTSYINFKSQVQIWNKIYFLYSKVMLEVKLESITIYHTILNYYKKWSIILQFQLTKMYQYELYL